MDGRVVVRELFAKGARREFAERQHVHADARKRGRRRGRSSTAGRSAADRRGEHEIVKNYVIDAARARLSCGRSAVARLSWPHDRRRAGRRSPHPDRARRGLEPDPGVRRSGNRSPAARGARPRHRERSWRPGTRASRRSPKETFKALRRAALKDAVLSAGVRPEQLDGRRAADAGRVRARAAHPAPGGRGRDARLARRARGARLQDILVTNQARLLAAPVIVERLFENPQLSTDIRRRADEFLEEFFLKKERERPRQRLEEATEEAPASRGPRPCPWTEAAASARTRRRASSPGSRR